MTMGKCICLITSVLLISLTGIGLYVFWQSGADSAATVRNAFNEMISPFTLDMTNASSIKINETSKNSPTVLLYTSHSGIVIFNSTTNTSTSLITTDRIVDTVSMDATHIYWSNYWFGNNGIYRAFKNGTGLEIIAFLGIGEVQELAVDWITGNIYFIDKNHQGIGVCTSSGSYCTLISTGDVTPRELALHPTTGVMYFSALGPYIFRSDMDGTSQVPMITDHLNTPTVLAIDNSTSALYWLDEGTRRIEYTKLDGTERKTVLDFNGTASSMSASGDRLFWNDMKTNSIYYWDKSLSKEKETLLQADDVIRGFYIDNPDFEPQHHNPCIGNPCEEICLLAADGKYSCACSSGKILKTNGKNCKRIKNGNREHLIVAAGGVLYDYNHGALGKPHWEKIYNSRYFGDVYNAIDKNLSSNDNQNIFDEISRFFRVKGQLGDIAFDHVGLNLYSTNVQDRRIDIMSVSTSQTTFIQLDDEPRAILLLPESAIMIVALYKSSGCFIKKMSMSGTGGVDLHFYSSTQVSLAFDFRTRRLLASNGRIIESISLNPEDTHREEIYTPNNAVSLAIIGDDIFWTEKDTKRIFWVEKDPGRPLSRNEIGMAGFNVTIPNDVDVMHLIQPNPNYKSEMLMSEEGHPCRVNNGGCSHVCLAQSRLTHVCRCSPDMVLNDDEKTCRFEWDRLSG